MRLKQAVEENNRFMEQKLHEFVSNQSMLGVMHSNLPVIPPLFIAEQSPQVRSECNNNLVLFLNLFTCILQQAWSWK